MKKWTKLFAVAASLLVISTSLVACSSSSTKETAKSDSDEKITLKVGATGQSFPNSYKDGDKLVGYDVEVLETIADKLGYELEWTTGAFDGLLASLNANKLDTIANNFAITPERSETVDFTEPYAYTASGIAVLEDSKYESTEDLAGETVGGVAGSNKLTELEAYIAETKLDIDIRQYDTREGPQEDTIKGQVAGYVQDKAVLAATIKKDDLALRVLPEDIATGEVAFPFAKNERGEKLRKAFDKELKVLLEDGTIKKLSEKYYGIDVTKEN
ncbi:MAG: transporter substrate-binding domain-containing protein [Streptococcaceae bacterium]|jgi:putative amino-acid transport system substrate-binding protein|nr:transporter substrate-binding domain-containing protein [Streptococcaceae bacterium]MCH4177830.1 transporter substrate-binding domain-containing protein [Streptococcaceae bacterium]